MRKAILDTDILSEIVRAKNPDVLRKARSYLDEFTRFSFTSTTMLEILTGLYTRDAKRQLEAFKEFFRTNEQIVPMVNDYVLAAQVMGMLNNRGTPIGDVDPLIAACAVRRKLPVVTGNLRHYQFVIDAGFPLELENWREP